ncbi:MAG: hypothetical protein CL908_23295 [Deltaproteobacteria bacterium]|nr:hypothetical protein [Deltaproteobacteria bacterium]
MIKLLSFKTRRPGLTSEAFRSHYETRHVPLGLSFIDHFRWRKYVRNYVVGPGLGRVGFDCLTEFWVAGSEDQERTARFVGSPEFSVLDEDDRRFLDVAHRLSFEVEEHLLAGVERERDPAGVLRLAMFISKPTEVPAAEFAADALEKARVFAQRHGDTCDRIELDLPTPDSSARGALRAVLSVWPHREGDRQDLAWPEIENSIPGVCLEAVETSSEALFSGQTEVQGIESAAGDMTAHRQAAREKGSR